MIRVACYQQYFVEELEGSEDSTCVLHVFQWLDLEGWLGYMNNFANIAYFDALVDRSHKLFPRKD